MLTTTATGGAQRAHPTCPRLLGDALRSPCSGHAKKTGLRYAFTNWNYHQLGPRRDARGVERAPDAELAARSVSSFRRTNRCWARTVPMLGGGVRGCREASSVSQLGAVRDLGCSGLASFCSSHTQEKLDSASLPYIKRACKAVRPGAWYRSSYKNAPLPNPPSVANLPSRCDSRSHQNDARDAAAALFSRKVAVPIGTKVHATP